MDTEKDMAVESPSEKIAAADRQRHIRNHEKDMERLAKFRPMDDTFMRAMLAENIPLAQMTLRIITGKPDLVITDFKTQADMKRVTGGEVGLPGCLWCGQHGEEVRP